jgi:dienelactone hydrolase
MVVLQVPDIGKEDTPGWMEENAASYRAAIQKLARSGVVDRHRVGIIGWSHSGVFVLQSVEDDPAAFKAATMATASSNSYSEFLANVDHVGGNVAERYFFDYLGAWPWGNELKIWLARSPGFRTDRICAPILYQVNDAAELVFLGWDDYAILRAQHKPVDLLYIRNGAHALIQPRERLVEQQMNVDWFDYWLNGHKSSHPAMAGEYRRWNAMRKSLPACPASDVQSPTALSWGSPKSPETLLKRSHHYRDGGVHRHLLDSSL